MRRSLVITVLLLIIMSSVSFVVGRETVSNVSTQTIGSQTIVTTTEYGWFAQINYTVRGTNLTTITCTLLPENIQQQYWEKSLAMVTLGNPTMGSILSLLVNKLPVYGCDVP